MLLIENCNNNIIRNNKQKQENNSKKEKIINKKDLQNITNLQEYFKNNHLKFYNQLENFEFLDSGTESNVYKFNFKGNKNKYIFKLIINEKREKRNKLEIIISHKLKHQNIINFISYYPIKDNESECVIMENGSFGNIRNFLKNIIKKNYFSETMLCYIALQILNGLKYCQNCKIVHYDLKPENIIINNQLNVKIIDYSVSLDYRNITSEDIQLNYCGTKFYMAPEVIKSETIKLKHINKIDLFSLGVILYKFAFCCYPFDLNHEDSNDTIYEKIMNNNLEINEDYEYSKYFVDFLKKLLEKDINKRININEALEHYWIKGADIIMNEKEKIFNANTFLANLITDSFYNFNNFLKEDKKNL